MKVTLRDLKRSYKNGFSLRVKELTLAKPGAIYALTGSNGAGKSTLLSVLGLMDRAYAGNYFLNERPARTLSRSERRNVTLLFQQPYLFRDNVEHNVSFGLALRGVKGRELKTKVEGVLSGLGISDISKEPISRLSGGQKQLVALARVLCLDVSLLLLDEPTNHLDEAYMRRVEEYLHKKKRNTTIVCATHDVAWAERLADTTITLKEGSVAEVHKHAIV